MENFPSPSNQLIGHSGIQKEEEQNFLSINISELETSTVETTNDSQVPEKKSQEMGAIQITIIILGSLALASLLTSALRVWISDPSFQKSAEFLTYFAALCTVIQWVFGTGNSNTHRKLIMMLIICCWGHYDSRCYVLSHEFEYPPSAGFEVQQNK